MTRDIKNLAASVHDRLKRIAYANNQPFQEVLTHYALIRFLYRLYQSKHSNAFVLKGALMFYGWGLPLRRPTLDIDLQGFTTNSVDNLVSMIRDVCHVSVEPDDGMKYEPESIRGEVIMHEAEYQGVRVHLKGSLGNAIIPFHIDISFANEITPSARIVNYPTELGELGLSPFPILGYPYETSIAEKFQTMIALGILNSRMKDYYDIWVLSHEFEIEGKILVDAFMATFRARSTLIPTDVPIALTGAFVKEKLADWGSFQRRLPASSRISTDLSQIIADLREFLVFPMQAASKRQKFNMIWHPGEGWKTSK